MDFVIVLGALVFLMVVAYRGYSVILFAPIAAMGAVLLTDPSLVAPMFTGLFMDKMVGFLKLYFPVFLLGAVFGIGMAATILVAQAIRKLRKLGSECIFSIAIEPIQAQHATAKWIHGQSSSVPSAPTSREIRPRVLASPVRPNGLLRCAFPSSGLRRR